LGRVERRYLLGMRITSSGLSLVFVRVIACGLLFYHGGRG
jgi:hypothetical protein